MGDSIVIRADASASVGAGHIMRAVAFAERFPLRNGRVHVVCASVTDSLRAWMEARDVVVHVIAPDSVENDAALTSRIAQTCDAYLVVVDHYGLDAGWERALGARPYLLVIDDVGGRDHACDALLDPTIGADARHRHLPDTTLRFIGPQYALLRCEFDAVDADRAPIDRVRRLLVFLGGAVTAGDVIAIVDAIQASAGGPHAIDETRVVLGRAFADAEAVRAHAGNGAAVIEVIEATDDMLGLMRWADLAVGASGGAQWERCAVGLPTLLVRTNDNQAHDVEAFVDAGVARDLGPLSGMSTPHWQEALSAATGDVAGVNEMARHAATLLAGRQHTIGDAVNAIDAAARAASA